MREILLGFESFENPTRRRDPTRFLTNKCHCCSCLFCCLHPTLPVHQLLFLQLPKQQRFQVNHRKSSALLLYHLYLENHICQTNFKFFTSRSCTLISLKAVTDIQSFSAKRAVSFYSQPLVQAIKSKLMPTGEFSNNITNIPFRETDGALVLHVHLLLCDLVQGKKVL